MSERISIADLKGSVNIVDVVGKYISLKKTGMEYVGICCFHDDSHASLKVNEKKQIFSCFACGAKGDVVDFLTRKGNSINEAIQELQSMQGNTMVRTEKKNEDWKQTSSKDVPAFQIKHFEHGKPSGVWRYTNLLGDETIGFTCRFDLPGGKVVLPYTIRTNGKHNRWMWKGFDKPNPLYNWSCLPNNPEKIVLITEGEKTTDAAAKIFPEFNCISWMGGAQRWQNADWAALKEGFNVILWPDNDEPGVKAMHEIGCIISKFEKTQRIRVIRLLDGLPKHFDVADFFNYDNSVERAKKYLKTNLMELNT